jgi:hypothetical protein
MTEYDPNVPPDPDEWSEMDEEECIAAALEYHQEQEGEMQRIRMHAMIHATVENQVAMGEEIPVAATVERLMGEGLSRHDAIHAVGCVLSDHLQRVFEGDAPSKVLNRRYYRELKELTPESWRERFEE